MHVTNSGTLLDVSRVAKVTGRHTNKDRAPVYYFWLDVVIDRALPGVSSRANTGQVSDWSQNRASYN